MIATLLVVLVLLSALALAVHRVGQATTVMPTRALPAVVLGARVFPDGRASDALADRVRTGVALLREGHATRLVLSGGSPDTRPTEAAVMRDLALSFGADAAALQLESASRSTFENAARCAELLGEREVLLVTCDFHTARARAHFHTRGFTVWPVPSKRALRPVDRWRCTLKEVAALLVNPRLLRAFRSPPKV